MIEIRQTDDLVTQRIKTRINKEGYDNQKEFCQSFDPPINESLLSDIFNSKRRTVDNMLRIANQLHCSLDYLVGLSEIPKREWSETDKTSELIHNEVGLSFESINHLRCMPNDQIELLNCLLTSKQSDYLFKQLVLYFKLDKDLSDFAHVYTDEEIVFVGDKEYFELSGYVDDHYILMDEFERIKLNVISDCIKTIKENSSFQIEIYKNEIIRNEDLGYPQINIMLEEKIEKIKQEIEEGKIRYGKE